MILSKAVTHSPIADPMFRCAIVVTAVRVVPGGKGFLRHATGASVSFIAIFVYFV